MRKIHAMFASMVMIALLLPACLPTSPDCRKVEVFCVGLVTDLNPINDKAFNQSAWEGLQQAKVEDLIDRLEYIESTDARDYSKNISTFADLGYDLILTVGYALGEETTAAAAAYPSTYFIGVDQYQDWQFDEDTTNDLLNLAGLSFPEDQAGFLAGALAASMTQTAKVGAVCSSDAYADIWRYCEGFRAGVNYIDPDVDVSVIYHNDISNTEALNDPEWGAVTSDALVDEGVDVIFGTGDDTGIGAIITAAARGIYAIGADFDQYKHLPEAAPRLLSSAIKLISPGVFTLVQVTRDAQTGSAAYPAGNYTGTVGMAPFHDLEDDVPEEIKNRLQEISLLLSNGELLTGVSVEKP